MFKHQILLVTSALMFCIVQCEKSITLTSSMSGRKFACSSETVVYNCSGIGSEIDMFVPPRVTSDSPLTYVRGDIIGSGLSSGPINTILVSTDYPYMNASLFVVGSQLTKGHNFTIYCAVRSPLGEDQIEQAISDVPPEFNVDSVSLSVKESQTGRSLHMAWMQNNGSYDFSYHTIRLFVNDTEMQPIQVTDSYSTILPIPEEYQKVSAINVTAAITTTSKCNQTSREVFTDPKIFFDEISAGVIVKYPFQLLFSAMTVALAII